MKSWYDKFASEFKMLFQKIKDWTAICCGKCCAFVAGILIVCAIFLSIGAIYGFTQPRITQIYSHIYVLTELEAREKHNPYSNKEKEQIKQLVDKNRIVPVTTVYKDTLDYYDSLISVLVALLGIFAFVSWFSMRSKIKEEMRDTIESGMKTGPFKDRLKDTIEDSVEIYLKQNLSDHLSDVPQIGLSEEQIRQIISQTYELTTEKIKEEILEDLKKPLEITPIPETQPKKKDRGRK